MSDHSDVQIDELRSLRDQIRSSINRVPMEQKARYKELEAELAGLEQARSSGVDACDVEARALELLQAFRKFSTHLEFVGFAAA